MMSEPSLHTINSTTTTSNQQQRDCNTDTIGTTGSSSSSTVRNGDTGNDSADQDGTILSPMIIMDTAAAQPPSDDALPLSPTSKEDTNVIKNACSMEDGAMILFATDEWFGSADHLLIDTVPPIFEEQLYCSQGKVMDGWETCRKRQYGHDFCIIQLSQRFESITSIQIDTAYFTGNQTPYVSIATADFGSNTISNTSSGRSSIDRETDFVNALPNATRRLLVQMKRRCWWYGPQQHSQQHSLPNVDEYRGTSSTVLQIQQAKDACRMIEWTERLPMTPLRPGIINDSIHTFSSSTSIPSLSTTTTAATHVRFNYYPDGGVARLRIYGVPAVTSSSSATNIIPKQPLYMPITTCDICTVIPYNDNNDNDSDNEMSRRCSCMPLDDDDDNNTNTDTYIIEISSCHHGGSGTIYCTNEHYGTPQQLLSSHTGIDMSDGWETARQSQRPQILQPLQPPLQSVPQKSLLYGNSSHGALVDFGDLMEYCIIRLGAPISSIYRIIIDTKHFKGNYPESIELSGCYVSDDDTTIIDWANNNNDNDTKLQWFPILHRCRLSPHAIHIYDTHQIIFNSTATTCTTMIDNLTNMTNTSQMISHVRIRIFPDGGLSRIRIFAPLSTS